MAGSTEAKRLEIISEDIDNLLEIVDRYDPIIRVELQEFYESLNEVDKIVFALKIQGYTNNEIANYFGVSRRRIRQRLKRIIKKMIEYVE